MNKPTTSRRLYHEFRQAFNSGEIQKLVREDEDHDDHLAKDEAAGPSPQVLQPRKYLRHYVGWLGHYWHSATTLIALSLCVAVLQMTHPLFLRFILDRILLVEGLESTEKLRFLHITGLCFLGVILVQQTLNVIKDYRTKTLNARVVLSLRRALFRRILHLPLSRLTDMKTGGIISRLTGDVNMTSGLLQLGLISPGVSLIRLAIAMSMLFFLNWRLALTSLAIIPVVTSISYFIARRVRPIYRSIRKDASHVDARVGETFGGIRVVRGFQREILEDRTHAVGRHSIVRKQLFAHRRELALWTVWGFMLACISLVTVWFGGFLYVRGQATIGDIMAFQFYAMLLLNPVWQIVNSFSELQRSLAAMERVFGVLEMAVDKPDVDGATEAPTYVHEIRFQHVCFEYQQDAPVLVDFDVVVPGGSTVALVGRSGAGKTTVTDLVARFYDPTSGRISVNGQDIRQMRLASYRNRLGIVQQDVFLFDGTIRDNIAYGMPSAADNEVVNAARRANAHEFIMDLAAGYDSTIGERGVKLSGGQAQRVSIARAILADPQILILDEATSSLDSESEQLIQQSIAELLTGRTTFVVAHRLSTITDADLILVLDDGRIVEQGTHETLMAAEGLYHDMVGRQQNSMLC